MRPSHSSQYGSLAQFLYTDHSDFCLTSSDPCHEEKQRALDILSRDYKETKAQLTVLNENLTSSQLQNEQLIMNSSATVDVQSTAIESMQEKQAKTESELKLERERIAKLEKEIGELKNSKYEETKELSKQVKDAEANVQAERRKNNQMQISNKQLKSQVETVTQELSDYKDKAKSILKSKERLITHLKTSDSKIGYILENNLKLFPKKSIFF